MEKKFKEITVRVPENIQNINEQFWYAINYLREEGFKKLDTNGELKEFGSETPLSTVDIYTKLWLERATFLYNLNAFKEYMKSTYNREITPVLKAGRVSFYRAGDIQEFEIYYNLKRSPIKL